MPEYAPNIRFTVSIDGYGSLGSWSKCDGLAVEYEVFEYQEGGLNEYVHRLPGRRKYSNVKLTRPLDKDSQTVVQWVTGLATKVERKNAEIAVLDSDGEVLCRWNLHGVYPLKWTGPALDAAGNQVAIETLEIAHNGFLGEG
jgi:phage tail-like protein